MKLGNFGKIGICWGLIVAAGIGAFALSKKNIDKKRYDHMKVRERMRNSNIGEYEPSTRKFSG